MQGSAQTWSQNVLLGQWKSTIFCSLPARKTEIPHTKKKPHIPEKEQARLWDNLSAWGQGASRLHPACSVQGKCRWLLPENTSTLPKSRLCPSSCASSNSACDFSTKSSAHESNFESPQKNCLCVWCLKVPLRKLKEREITSKSPGGFSCKWEAYVIW